MSALCRLAYLGGSGRHPAPLSSTHRRHLPNFAQKRGDNESHERPWCRLRGGSRQRRRQQQQQRQQQEKEEEEEEEVVVVEEE